MLLLDHNLPHPLRDLLASLGMEAETAAHRGWERLRNGDLVSAASQAGFKAILTRDVKFSQSASTSLLKFPEMSILVIRLPQRSSKLYLSAFRTAWENAPYAAEAGKVIFWP
jgi:predicted nuclease of predicted toxin-antitoxin system